MQDSDRALQNPTGSLAIPIPYFRSRFLTGARITDLGTLMDKAPGDPTDPLELLWGGNRRGMAAGGSPA